MQYGYFNTASGIIQKQSFLMVATIAFIALFQYRKRYVNTVTPKKDFKKWLLTCLASFNTASGITLLQQVRGDEKSPFEGRVSIPQAVWPSCNAKIEIETGADDSRFQYRKRYGPVATVIMNNPVWNIGFQYRKRYYPVATLISPM